MREVLPNKTYCGPCAERGFEAKDPKLNTVLDLWKDKYKNRLVGTTILPAAVNRALGL